jgi:hypothetical protein
MDQPEGFRLNADYMTRKRREHSGFEASARAVPDRRLWQFFAANIQVAVYRKRTEEVDGPIDFGPRRGCRVDRQFLSPRVDR